MIKVLGLDLSLTATGVAGIGWAETLRAPAQRVRDAPLDYAHRRLDFYRDALADRYLRGVQLAVVEGPALGHHNTGTYALWGQSWLIRHLLWQRGIPYAVVSPTVLKLYATGKGNADKAAVTAAVRGWWPAFDGDHNAADAAVLAAMGAHHLGYPLWPVPQAQAAALAGVAWPELPALEVIA